MLTSAEQWQHVDPQRMYTGADIAFFTGYTTRTLTQYKYAAGRRGHRARAGHGDRPRHAQRGRQDLVAFTIRDGVSFEDGTPVTCADIKYGVSRTFATDIITDGPTYAISYLDIPKAEDGTSVYKGPFVTDGQRHRGVRQGRHVLGRQQDHHVQPEPPGRATSTTR